MNVAILVAGLPPDRVGGSEFQASRVAQHLAEHHRVTVFTRTATIPAELASLPGCVVAQRCRITVPGLRFGADIVRTLVLIGRCRKTIDVIIAYQTVIDGLIGVLAKILFGIPVVVAVRGGTEYQLDRYPQSRLFSPFVFRHADRLTVQSPAIAEELLKAFEGVRRRPRPAEIRAKLCVIPNGAAATDEVPADGHVVLYVGRLTKTKGVCTLIEAMRQCPNEVLVIVGDGPERPTLERAAQDLTNVSFAGTVPHAKVDEYLAHAKVLVLPSLHECQPNVVMEAMGRGVPAIASRVGGVPDLVKHGETGFLIEPGDSSAIARYINMIAGDAHLRTRLATNCLTEIRRYRWPVVIEALQRQLLEVVPAGRRLRSDLSGPREG